MTQLQAARKGIVTAAMKAVAQTENLDPLRVCAAVASGEAVIPLNPHHKYVSPIGIGRLFTTKINANLGCSLTHSDVAEEVEKLRVALAAGADLVMDLSVGADNLAKIRQRLLDVCSHPLGTVPIYETISRLEGDIPQMNPEFLLDVIREQAEQGVDFMTLHAGIKLEHISLALKRKMGIVSRGGAILAEWMLANESENPIYQYWDEILDILVKHDVTVSLGDGLRPGCLADASDSAQFGELEVLGELVRRCRARGVQVMVEGPGHIPFDQIKMNMVRQQMVCENAPFYVLGPITTDIAAGYDHIASAIGATAAATYGASLLCYVTPAEHLGLPTAEEVRQGCIAHRIAAHTADIARGLPGARQSDDLMAEARAAFDWEGQFQQCLAPKQAKARWTETRACTTAPHDDDHCSMCGKQFCAVRTTHRIRQLAQATR